MSLSCKNVIGFDLAITREEIKIGKLNLRCRLPDAGMKGSEH